MGLNGKVIGEFICNEVDKIVSDCQFGYLDYLALCDTCLSIKEIQDYGKGKALYGWHISDLKIYDKPRELSEFYRECEKQKCEGCPHLIVENTSNSYETYCEVNEKLPITRPPQSWCYVEEEK